MSHGKLHSSNQVKVCAFSFLVCGGCYAIGFLVSWLTYPEISQGMEFKQDFMLSNRYFYEVWYFIIYILFGTSLASLIVTFPINKRICDHYVSRLGASFGLIWVCLVITSGMVAIITLETMASIQSEYPQYVFELWMMTSVIQEATGGGIEFVGGLWMLCICSKVSWNSHLNNNARILGVVIGFSGILTVITVSDFFGVLFGVGQLVWFNWLGFLLMKNSGLLMNSILVNRKEK